MFLGIFPVIFSVKNMETGGRGGLSFKISECERKEIFFEQFGFVEYVKLWSLGKISNITENGWTIINFILLNWQMRMFFNDE